MQPVEEVVLGGAGLTGEHDRSAKCGSKNRRPMTGSESGISHRAGWRQGMPFSGRSLPSEMATVEIFGAYELKSIAIQ
jgi:hypothetical protein